MLTLNDGRFELWQWDTGRTLAVDADCSQVHFSNKVFGRSIDVDVIDGVAIIPDVLLQTDKDLNVWAFVGTAENGYTKISKTFKVNRRNKPSDYVFTPSEQTTLAELSERLDKIEESQDPDEIKNAVNDYLEQNPVESPVKSVNRKTGAVELTANDVGAISQDDLQTATNEALAQAKASGEFDGADGQPGENGADGYSPSANVTQNGNGVTITITDKNGTTTATVTNGKDGSDGSPGADGKSSYQYAVEGGYTGTEAEFAAKQAQEKFVNPNALTFTGAATGSYDGSAPLTVEIPSGGSGGTDISLGLTSAAIGQIIKVKAIDDTGKPTEWEATDMPSGGGGDDGAKEFRLIQSITLGEQSDRVDISVDSSGSAFALHEVYVMLSAQSYEDAYNEVTFLPNGRWGSDDAYIVSSNKASKSSETWKNNMAFHSVYAGGVICSEQLPSKGQNFNLFSSFSINQAIITKISIVCKFAAGCTFLVIGR